MTLQTLLENIRAAAAQGFGRNIRIYALPYGAWPVGILPVSKNGGGFSVMPDMVVMSDWIADLRLIRGMVRCALTGEAFEALLASMPDPPDNQRLRDRLFAGAFPLHESLLPLARAWARADIRVSRKANLIDESWHEDARTLLWRACIADDGNQPFHLHRLAMALTQFLIERPDTYHPSLMGAYAVLGNALKELVSGKKKRDCR